MLAECLKSIRVLCCLCLLIPAKAMCADVLVAVASNFLEPMRALAHSFEQETGYKVAISSASSGKIYAQIRNGAPFDLFYSADQDKPARLMTEGFGLTGSSYTYALGNLVLWSSDPLDQQSIEQRLKALDYRKLAIANPRLAPYGVAAVEVLSRLGLRDQIQSKLIQGENINQTYQFVASRNAEMGFIALSQLKASHPTSDQFYWHIPSSLYSPIRQDAVALKHGEKNPAVLSFRQFMQSPQAKAVILSYGYSDPA